MVGIIHHSFVTAFAIVAPAGGSNNGALFPFRDPAQLFLSELDIYQCFIFSLQRTLSLLEVRSKEQQTGAIRKSFAAKNDRVL